MRLSANVAFTGKVVRSLVRLAPHPDNRILRIVLDSDHYYRSSDVQLNGAGAPRSFFFDWQSLPVGNYKVVATVLGQDGPRGRSSLPLNVYGVSGR